MKTMNIFLIVVAMLSPLSLSPNLVCSAEVPGESKYDTTECYTGDNLGYWFDDLQWLGFAVDDWSSLGSITEGSSKAFPSERVLLLLRHSKGRLRPYLSIDPGLIISENGFELDLSTPKVLLGLSCNF
jgi:hypothetical protein